MNSKQDNCILFIVWDQDIYNIIIGPDILPLSHVDELVLVVFESTGSSVNQVIKVVMAATWFFLLFNDGLSSSEGRYAWLLVHKLETISHLPLYLYVMWLLIFDFINHLFARSFFHVIFGFQFRFLIIIIFFFFWDVDWPIWIKRVITILLQFLLVSWPMLLLLFILFV